jgi:NADH-quinone oxidoreductase subunit E
VEKIKMKTIQTIQFPADTLELVHNILKRYPEGKQKSAILPILHLAQAEWKWVSPEVMDYVATLMDIKPIEVYEVATFYTMFHLEPVGDHVIEYCRTGPCCVMGGVDVYNYIKQKLGIKAGETTADGKFTLKEVECLAACGWGPVFQIREKFYMNLTNEKVDEIIGELNK